MNNQYIENYYNTYNEDERLTSRHGNIEFLTTMKYIHDYTQIGDKILDVGAGTGRYSIPLSREGYDVTALELVAHNLEVLKSKLTPSDSLSTLQGNALDLSRFNDETFDAVLVFGPMYHLYSKDDKLNVLNEAKRVTKKNGHLFIAYCLNEATLIQWAFNGNGQNMLDCLQNHMLTPDYQCISKPIDLFEMVRIEDIDSLNTKSNLTRLKLIGTDLFSCYIREQMNDWSEEAYKAYIAYHLSICERKDLIGISNHVLDLLVK